MDNLLPVLSVFGGSIAVMAVIVALLYVAHRRLLSLYANRPADQYRRQLIMLGLSLLALVLLIVIIPVSDTMQGQLLGFVGILLSATIALSSTTLVGNALAGLMLKGIGNIQPGCYIRVGEHFGRVSEADLLHTEIQTEDRDLTTLPNLYLVTNPVTVMRTSGTIISVELSLGYDIPRTRIEKLLIQAATDTGLGDPFVQISALGDFSVTYRIAGLAEDLSKLIGVKRTLRAKVVDALHEGDIEIVSPTFMNTRAFDAKTRFIPHPQQADPADTLSEKAPDDVIFDKASEAENLAALRKERDELDKRVAEIDAELKGIEDDQQRRRSIFEKKKILAQLARLEKKIYSAESKIAED